MALTIYFDLDGPILDVSQRYYRLHCDLAASLQIAPLAFETYWELKRNQAPVERILPEISPAQRAHYLKQRLTLIETPQYLLYDRSHPWAPEVLRCLHGQHRLVLVTLRNRREHLLWQLDHLQLGGFFELVLSRDGNGGDWQAKRDLLLSDERLTSDALLVGDTEGDILAGQSLGFVTIAVTCGIRTEERLETLAPSRIIPDIRLLPDIAAAQIDRQKNQEALRERTLC